MREVREVWEVWDGWDAGFMRGNAKGSGGELVGESSGELTGEMVGSKAYVPVISGLTHGITGNGSCLSDLSNTGYSRAPTRPTTTGYSRAPREQRASSKSFAFGCASFARRVSGLVR